MKKMALLAEHGRKQEILDARGVAQLDPVFEPVQAKIAGAIRNVGIRAVVRASSSRISRASVARSSASSVDSAPA